MSFKSTIPLAGLLIESSLLNLRPSNLRLELVLGASDWTEVIQGLWSEFSRVIIYPHLLRVAPFYTILF